MDAALMHAGSASPCKPTLHADSKMVCRTLQISEGLDFTDGNARAVLLVGIPFPNVKVKHCAQSGWAAH